MLATRQGCSRTCRQAGTLPGGQARETGKEGAALEYAGGGRKAGRQEGTKAGRQEGTPEQAGRPHRP